VAGAAGTTTGSTDPGLATTGQKVTLELVGGISLLALGLLTLAAARRRQLIERMKWPDER
jgi:hypothetical protein